MFKTNLKNLLNYKEIYKFYNLKIFEFLFYCILSFTLPFLIKSPQWIIGIIVNFFLIRSAIYFELKYVLPIVIFPSIGVFTAGIIFGVNTFYLLYFLPIIWIGNFLFILSYKFLRFKKNKNIWITPIYSSIIKSGIIFIFASIMVLIFEFPIVFLKSMGYMQLITAVIGSYLATISYKII